MKGTDRPTVSGLKSSPFYCTEAYTRSLIVDAGELEGVWHGTYWVLLLLKLLSTFVVMHWEPSCRGFLGACHRSYM